MLTADRSGSPYCLIGVSESPVKAYRVSRHFDFPDEVKNKCLRRAIVSHSSDRKLKHVILQPSDVAFAAVNAN